MDCCFKISGFADEIDPDINKQFEHLNKLGIKYFEVRGVNGKNISKLTDSEVESLKDAMKSHNISVSSIGSPIGKVKMSDDLDAHFNKFMRVVEIAKKLNSKYIRIFSFYPPDGENIENYRGKIIENLKKMAKYAEKEGVILLHENEKDIYGDTPERCKDLFDNIKSDAFKGVFDPANFVQCGCTTYPDAWNLLKGHIVYMHIKDAKAENGDVVPAGYGGGNIAKIISELKKDGYNGFLSLEPHLGTFLGLEALETDDKMMSLEKSGPEKFTIAYEALMKIVNEK